MSLPILLFYGFAFVGIVHSAIFSILAFNNKKPAELIITMFLFVQSLIILEYVFFWTGLYIKHHYLNNISMTIQFLFGPLLYMYVDYVFYENKRFRNYLTHFLPAAVVFIFMLPYYFSTADLKVYHYKMIRYFVLDLNLLTYLIMVHMGVYSMVIFYKINKEKRIGHINNWLSIITGLFGFYTLCYISYFIMVRQPWFTLTTDYFVSTGMCASILAIIYLAYGKKKIFDGFQVTESIKPEDIYFSFKKINPGIAGNKKKGQPVIYTYQAAVEHTIKQEKIREEAETIATAPAENLFPTEFSAEPKYKNSGLTPDAGKELAQALQTLMDQENLYRECELKLELLAHKLNVPKHYVSQVINQYYGVNFFEYINILRIEEAKKLLVSNDKKNQHIIEIAYAVGYNTKNTFNSAFRRLVGVTPTAYRNQNRVRMN